MDLERWQAARIYDRIGPTLGYLYRLKRRMWEVGCKPDDPLLRMVEEVFDKLHPLSVELHYRSIRMGLGDDPAAAAGVTGLSVVDPP